MKNIVCLIALLFCGKVYAHEMTPTYPEFRRSFIDGIHITTVRLFNRRTDVEYYEIGVFDSQWKPLTFATESRIIKLEYLKKKTIDVYVRNKDLYDVSYICTKSKILEGAKPTSMVSSKICSKVK